MFDFDLAELYEVETRVLNQAVKRNKNRFPSDFMFKLTIKEWENMSSQNVMTSPFKRPKKPCPLLLQNMELRCLPVYYGVKEQLK